MSKAAKAIFFKGKEEEIKAYPTNFFDVSAKDIKGNLVNFKDFEGKYKAFLVVNVACLCGYTYGNYKQLNEVFETYRERGLAIFAFPCNQFGGQEKGSEMEIEEYVKNKFNSKFQLFSKIEVNGPNAHPLYNYLRRNSSLYNPETNKSKEIPWNFAKFLLDAKGNVVQFYSSEVDPNTFTGDIEKLVQ